MGDILNTAYLFTALIQIKFNKLKVERNQESKKLSN